MTFGAPGRGVFEDTACVAGLALNIHMKAVKGKSRFEVVEPEGIASVEIELYGSAFYCPTFYGFTFYEITFYGTAFYEFTFYCPGTPRRSAVLLLMPEVIESFFQTLVHTRVCLFAPPGYFFAGIGHGGLVFHAL